VLVLHAWFVLANEARRLLGIVCFNRSETQAGSGLSGHAVCAAHHSTWIIKQSSRSSWLHGCLIIEVAIPMAGVSDLAHEPACFLPFPLLLLLLLLRVAGQCRSS
jgi:hypothetical protein